MKVVKFVFKLIPLIICSSFWIKLYNFKKDKISRIKAYRKIKKLLDKVAKKIGVEYVIDGKENLPLEQSYLLVPNHQSMLDPFIFFHLFDDPVSFVCKKEVKKMPLVSDIVEITGGKYLERDNLKQEIKVMRSISKDMENRNVRYVLFPEGTRTKDENYQMNEFKPGALKFPMNAGVKIVPVCLHGTSKVFDKKFKQKKYQIHVSILPPVTKEEYQKMNTNSLALELKNRIQNRLNVIISNENL